MKLFDADAVCSKCGSKAVTTIYHPGGCTHCGRCHTGYSCEGPNQEHMVRVCALCHFEWYEAPLPAVDSSLPDQV